MAANGISTLSTKQQRQQAKLALAATKRGETNRSSLYRSTSLPTSYEGNNIVDNTTELVAGRPWLTFDNYLSTQTDGLYFDFTKTDRYFQESTGPTLADDVGEAIGLGLDQRTWGGQTLAQVLAAASEMRGDYSINTIGVVTDATYNPSTGQGTANRIDSSNLSGVKISATLGNWYLLDIEKTGGTGTLTIRTGSSIGTSPGSHPQTRAIYLIYVNTGTGVFISSGTNSSSVDFTLHSIKEVPGKHALQSSASLRPLRQTGYSVGNNPELKSTGYISGIGTAPAATYNTSTGVGTAERIDASNRSYVTFDVSAEKYYALNIHNTGATQLLVRNSDGTNSLAVNAGVSVTLVPGFFNNRIRIEANNAQAVSFTVNSLKVVASTYLQAKFDGSDDNLLTNYYANVQADGPELVTNGTFDSATGWTISASGTTISGGSLNWDGSAGGFGTNFVAQTDLNVSLAKLYAITYTVTRTAGSIRVNLGVGGATAGPARSASGTYTNYIAPTGSQPTSLSIQGDNFSGTVDNVSVKEVANQDNFMVALVDVPSTLSANQVISGADEDGDAKAFRITVLTGGTVAIKIGGTSVLGLGPDLRGTTAVIGLSSDGTNIRVCINDQEVYSQPSFTGVMPTTQPLRVGARNLSGGAAGHFGGSIAKLVVGREFLTLANYQQIRNFLLSDL